MGSHAALAWGWRREQQRQRQQQLRLHPPTCRNEMSAALMCAKPPAATTARRLASKVMGAMDCTSSHASSTSSVLDSAAE
jgi:hypothetical protein